MGRRMGLVEDQWRRQMRKDRALVLRYDVLDVRALTMFFLHYCLFYDEEEEPPPPILRPWMAQVDGLRHRMTEDEKEAERNR